MAATPFSGTAVALDLDEADTTKADSYSANSTKASVTLSDGTTTVDFALAQQLVRLEQTRRLQVLTLVLQQIYLSKTWWFKVLVTDTAGNKVDIGHTVLKGTGPTKQSKSQLDLAYAVSSKITLEQASIQATIEADPLEWYVYHGWAGAGNTTAKTFVGKDLAGNAVSKDVKGDGTTGVQTFTSIQGAIDAITTETGLRIRVEDHVEAGGNVNVDEDDLRIEFWDIAGAMPHRSYDF